jgi:hypothetical protein
MDVYKSFNISSPPANMIMYEQIQMHISHQIVSMFWAKSVSATALPINSSFIWKGSYE